MEEDGGSEAFEGSEASCCELNLLDERVDTFGGRVCLTVFEVVPQSVIVALQHLRNLGHMTIARLGHALAPPKEEPSALLDVSLIEEAPKGFFKSPRPGGGQVHLQQVAVPFF